MVILCHLHKNFPSNISSIQRLLYTNIHIDSENKTIRNTYVKVMVLHAWIKMDKPETVKTLPDYNLEFEQTLADQTEKSAKRFGRTTK